MPIQKGKKTFTTKSPTFNFVKSALGDAGITDKVKTVGVIAISAGFIQPGDVVAFNYRAENSGRYEPVVALVVQTRVSSGVRISKGTGNRLLTCFKIEDTSESQAILRRLYNNKVKSSIRRASRMFGWLDKKSLGDDNYRTYIMDSMHMSNMMEIKFKKGEL